MKRYHLVRDTNHKVNATDWFNAKTKAPRLKIKKKFRFRYLRDSDDQPRSTA